MVQHIKELLDKDHYLCNNDGFLYRVPEELLKEYIIRDNPGNEENFDAAIVFDERQIYEIPLEKLSLYLIPEEEKVLLREKLLKVNPTCLEKSMVEKGRLILFEYLLNRMEPGPDVEGYVSNVGTKTTPAYTPAAGAKNTGKARETGGNKGQQVENAQKHQQKVHDGVHLSDDAKQEIKKEKPAETRQRFQKETHDIDQNYEKHKKTMDKDGTVRYTDENGTEIALKKKNNPDGTISWEESHKSTGENGQISTSTSSYTRDQDGEYKKNYKMSKFDNEEAMNQKNSSYSTDTTLSTDDGINAAGRDKGASTNRQSKTVDSNKGTSTESTERIDKEGKSNIQSDETGPAGKKTMEVTDSGYTPPQEDTLWQNLWDGVVGWFNPSQGSPEAPQPVDPSTPVQSTDSGGSTTIPGPTLTPTPDTEPEPAITPTPDTGKSSYKPPPPPPMEGGGLNF